jgi:hypothetical protein
MTAMKTVDVICPNCRGSFRVPDGAAETLCAYCNEHIVWRQCLDTGEIFPVLTKWETWVHPGCESVHVVDLSVTIERPESPASEASQDEPADGDTPAPAGDAEPVPEPTAEAAEDTEDTAAADGAAATEAAADTAQTSSAVEEEQPGAAADDGPVCAMDGAEWVERELTGRLMIDATAFGIEPAAGRPVAISWTRDVLSYSLDRDPGEGRKRRFRRGAQPDGPVPTVLVVTSRGGTHTIRGVAEPDELTRRLETYLRPAITANENAQV